MILVIVAITLVSCAVLSLIGGIVHACKNRWYEGEEIVGLLGVILVVSVVVFGIIFMLQYEEAISLPQKIVALETTITQQKELISKIGDSDVVTGLEGIEVKKTIQGTIREYNLAIARLNYLNKNAWVYFKPRMINASLHPLGQ